MAPSPTDLPRPRSLFDKIWSPHVVIERDDGYQLLYIDRHLLHDGSSTAFAQLQARGLGVFRPERALATPDHYTSTRQRSLEAIDDGGHRKLVESIRTNTGTAGIRCFFIDDTGTFVDGDFLTALLAESVLEREPGASILYDVRASRAVPDLVDSRSQDGSVSIVLPRATYRVTTGSGDGSVDVDVPRDDTSAHRVSAHTGDGKITVRTAN